jgi:proteasome lid subunit RPN8/RPN11
VSNNYRFSLEFYPKDRNGGLSMPLSKPDVQPAVEYAQFEALKKNGQFPTRGSALFRPSYANGGPGLNGFAIEVPTVAGVYQAELPIDYFGDTAKDYQAALVSAGKLTADEECQWAMSAWESEDGIDCRAPAVELNPELVTSSMEEFIGRSKMACEKEADPFSIFMPRDVLEETADLARAASPMECGGVLLGNLHRDSSSGELFAVITAQIPAMKAVGSEIELRFTPDAWESVRAAVNLRKRGEIWCGWWHSHTPVAWADTCGQCPIERQRQCGYATRLFSASDRTLHRTVFARAFAIGLVANVLAGNEVIHSCFGWRQGRIGARSYFVAEDR